MGYNDHSVFVDIWLDFLYTMLSRAPLDFLDRYVSRGPRSCLQFHGKLYGSAQTAQ